MSESPDGFSAISTAVGDFTADVVGPDDGPLVVLLHGFPQTRHTWRSQMPALAEAGFRAVAFDQRGYSPGARPDPTDLADYHLDHLVADVLRIADQVRADQVRADQVRADQGRASAAASGGEPARFHLVGHDWGGAVAWAVADRHPERVDSLAVLSRPHPAAFRAAFRADPDQQHRSRHHKAFHDPETGHRLLADDSRRLKRLLVDNGVPPEGVEHYVSVLGDPAAMEAALAWYRAAGALTSIEVGPIAAPTLYLWGDNDNSVGRPAATSTGDYVTGPYRFVEVPGGGHFLTDDHPDEVTTALLEHLRRNR